MRAIPQLSLIMVLVAIAGGCASSGTGGGGSSGGDLVSSTELREYETQYSNALVFVDRRRSRWLRERRTRLAAGPADGACDPPSLRCEQTVRDQVSRAVVYVDGSRYGPLESLESMQTSSIEQLEYMSPTDATTRFGTGVDAGVILVTLR